MIKEWEILPYGQEVGMWKAMDLLGFIPEFLSTDDKRTVREQLDSNYRHGGGWSPMQSWRRDSETGELTYPGDPPYRPLARAKVREETVYVYPHAWVCIVQKDDTYEVARMD